MGSLSTIIRTGLTVPGSDSSLRAPLWRTAFALLAVLIPALVPHQSLASTDPGRSFMNEIACGKAPGMSAGDCRKAFAIARAEYLARTRSYPSRFACYRAYGPCSPWPANGGIFAHFRPQLMGVTLTGSGGSRTVVPVVAPGKARLAFAAHGLSDPPPTVMDTDAQPAPRTLFAGGVASESLCRQIAAGAAKAHLPPAFLARLLWRESSFRPHVVSRAGALGIAQFMPETALERGLDDPFDPMRAIESSAALLGDLTRRFGNLGLAAAAYNGGPARVSGWLKGRRALAAETESYVQAITGRSVQDWATRSGADAVLSLPGPCATVSPQAAR